VKPLPVLAALVLCALPAPLRAACREWSQSRCDAANTASIELDAPKSGTPRAWTFDGSGRTWGYEPGMTTWSSPALGVVDGRAVAAVGSYDHTIYALDAASGVELWKFTTGGPVFSAPIFWHEGTRTWLFAASSDRIVYAIDAAQGRQIWVHAAQDFRPTLGGARLSAPALGKAKGVDVVFVPYWIWDSSLGHNEQHGGVIALSAREGRPVWRKDLDDNELTTSIVKGSLLLLGTSNGNVLALDADDGREKWRQTELDSVRSQPAFAETTAGPLVIMASKYGTIRALDPRDGTERWRHKTGDRITGAPAVLGSGAGAKVLVGSYDRQLYALDAASGKELFRYAARGGLYSSPALVPDAAPPMVLVSGWDNFLHAVALNGGRSIWTAFTGRPLWSVEGLDESNWSSPAAARIGGQWMVYVGSYDGTLRALPLEDASRAAPALRSNLWFFLSFPLGITPAVLLAVYLTRRERRRSTYQMMTTASGTAR
jgi:eukaryotic-like serine/threonine-protein kinase